MSETKPTITVKEFRMWLQGVEEMQDSAWVPNPTQWTRIREKINCIEDIVSPQQSAPVPVAQQQVPRYNGYLEPGVPVQLAPSGLAYAPLPTVPSMPPSPPSHGLFATPESNNIPVRTPNIDSSNGYTSSFA